MKQTQISINVELDENSVPERIFWDAQDGGVENQETKAVMLSVWDEKTREVLRIDLWTKEMPLDHMKIFFHQLFISLGNTYHRASGDEETAERITQFAEEFAVLSKIK